MADNKEKDLEGIFPEQDDEALKKELEELKETFQQELDKATAEAETSEEENENENESEPDERKSLPRICSASAAAKTREGRRRIPSLILHRV